jgi:hypothetical protein
VTYQRDPDRGVKTPMSINRDGEGWGLVPILLGIAALVIIAYLAFGPRTDRAGTTQRTDVQQTSPTQPKPDPGAK